MALSRHSYIAIHHWIEEVMRCREPRESASAEIARQRLLTLVLILGFPLQMDFLTEPTPGGLRRIMEDGTACAMLQSLLSYKRLSHSVAELSGRGDDKQHGDVYYRLAELEKRNLEREEKYQGLELEQITADNYWVAGVFVASNVISSVWYGTTWVGKMFSTLVKITSLVSRTPFASYYNPMYILAVPALYYGHNAPDLFASIVKTMQTSFGVNALNTAMLESAKHKAVEMRDRHTIPASSIREVNRNMKALKQLEADVQLLQGFVGAASGPTARGRLGLGLARQRIMSAPESSEDLNRLKKEIGEQRSKWNMTDVSLDVFLAFLHESGFAERIKCFHLLKPTGEARSPWELLCAYVVTERQRDAFVQSWGANEASAKEALEAALTPKERTKLSRFQYLLDQLFWTAVQLGRSPSHNAYRLISVLGRPRHLYMSAASALPRRWSSRLPRR